MTLRKLAAAAAVGVVGSLVLLASPAQAVDGHYPAGGWLVQDTTIGADVDWSDCDPGPVRVDAVLSAIVSAEVVGLTTLGVPAPPHYGTSIETTNLGLLVSAGDTVSVDYALIEGASAAGGAVRLFIYSTANADTDCTAPDAFVAAAADATSGTLTVEVPFDGEIGTAGLVYDSSNGGVGGTVRFSSLMVNDTLVLFDAPDLPEPTPTVEPTVEPTTEPSGGPEGTAGDDEALPVTGSNLVTLLLLVGAIAAVAGGSLLWLSRHVRQRQTGRAVAE